MQHFHTNHPPPSLLPDPPTYLPTRLPPCLPACRPPTRLPTSLPACPPACPPSPCTHRNDAKAAHRQGGDQVCAVRRQHHVPRTDQPRGHHTQRGGWGWHCLNKHGVGGRSWAGGQAAGLTSPGATIHNECCAMVGGGGQAGWGYVGVGRCGGGGCPGGGGGHRRSSWLEEVSAEGARGVQVTSQPVLSALPLIAAACLPAFLSVCLPARMPARLTRARRLPSMQRRKVMPWQWA